MRMGVWVSINEINSALVYDQAIKVSLESFIRCTHYVIYLKVFLSTCTIRSFLLHLLDAFSNNKIHKNSRVIFNKVSMQ